MLHEDLPCQELVELVTDYFEGAMPAALRERFDAHLGICGPCREYLEQMRQTLRVVGRLTEESIPPAGRDQLLAMFRAWKVSESA